LPGVPVNVVGEYPAVSGLSGSWSRPLQEYLQVTADAVPVTWSVDSAVPSASGPYPLTWQGRNPVSPVVRLTDSSSATLLQDWVVIFAVAFGITGSVLASLLLEWLRRPSRDDTASVSTPASAHSPLRGRGQADSGLFPRECGPGGSRWLAPSSSSGTRGAAAPGPGTADFPGATRGWRKAVR
jgi:hypothetical protein